MIQNTESSADDAIQRAAAYEFLGRLWASEVDGDLLAQLLKPSDIHDAFLAAGGDIQMSAASVNELAEDYCQLFLGPTNHLPPYQSVWIDGQFAGESSVDMKKWCELVHFESTAIEPDQLGVQLTVMSRISATANVPMESDFFGRHLTWPSKLIATATQRARTGFYRSVTKMTAEFLESESARLLHHGEG